MSKLDYPRDMVGYGANPPNANWPDGARLALSFVINYEEGGESCILHGDDRSETLLAQGIGEPPVMAGRDIEAESIFEYGSRAGFWRLMRLFAKFDFPVTFYAVGMALESNPDAARAMVELGHEIATHGYRWVEYQHVSEAREREDIRRTIEVQQRVTGTRPVGYYGGRMSANTRRLVVEEGANTGVIESLLPSWRSSTIELQNVRSSLGLDVVGSVTFGALSQGELSLALNTALPTNLQEEALADWLDRKIDAQQKLSEYLTGQAVYLSDGDKTVGDWLRLQRQEQEERERQEAERRQSGTNYDFTTMLAAELSEIDVGTLTDDQFDAWEKRMDELGL